MSSIVLPKNHHSITTVNDVVNICDPLFKDYKINYFHYARIYNNNTACALTSHAELNTHHLKSGYKLSPPIAAENLGEKFYFLPIANQMEGFNQVFYDFRNLFHVDHPLFLIERYQGYFDLYIFGTHPNNDSIINFYMNNMDIIKNFKFYFKEKANKLIENATKNKFSIPESMRPNFKGLENVSVENDYRHEFSEKMNLSNYIFTKNGREVRLSKQERTSLKLLKLGNSTKEIAKLMNISPRTVETYINITKTKLECNKKSELIKIALTLDWLK